MLSNNNSLLCILIFCISFAAMNEQKYSEFVRSYAGRFKNWSRKGYAVFSSLGTVVHIGCLSVSLVQWIGQLLGLDNVDITYLQFKSEETDDELQEQEELMLVPVVIPTREGACHKNINRIY